MLKAEVEMVRQICKDEIKLAFGDAIPITKQIAKDAAAEEAKEAAKKK